MIANIKKNLLDHKINIALVGLFSLAFLALYVRIASPDYYSYDESDYIYAVRQGFVTNYLDTTSIPFGDFVALGLGKGQSSDERASLSEYIREKNDINIYRHFHGPAYYYYLMPIAQAGDYDEALSRYTSLLTIVLSAILAFFLIQRLDFPDIEGVFGATAAFVLIAWNRANLETAMQITPHALYVLFSSLSILLLCVWLKTGSEKYFYVSVVFAGLGLLTIEYAILLLLTQAAAYIFWITSSKPDKRIAWRMIRYALILFAAVIVLLWPGGIIKLGILRNYAFFAYYAIVRGDEYGGGQVTQAWLSRYHTVPLEFILILVASLFALSKFKKYSYLLPILVYSLLLVATTFRNADPSPTYYSSLLPPAFIVVGIAFSEALRSVRSVPLKIIAGVLVPVALLTNSISFYQESVDNVAYKPREGIVTYVLKIRPLTESLIVERSLVPLLNFYDPGIQYNTFSFSDGDEVAVGDIIERASAANQTVIICKQQNVEKILQIQGIQLLEQKDLDSPYAQLTVILP